VVSADDFLMRSEQSEIVRSFCSRRSRFFLSAAIEHQPAASCPGAAQQCFSARNPALAANHRAARILLFLAGFQQPDRLDCRDELPRHGLHHLAAGFLRQWSRQTFLSGPSAIDQWVNSQAGLGSSGSGMASLLIGASCRAYKKKAGEQTRPQNPSAPENERSGNKIRLHDAPIPASHHLWLQQPVSSNPVTNEAISGQAPVFKAQLFDGIRVLRFRKVDVSRGIQGVRKKRWFLSPRRFPLCFSCTRPAHFEAGTPAARWLREPDFNRTSRRV
jgi:hypothetical protein